MDGGMITITGASLEGHIKSELFTLHLNQKGKFLIFQNQINDLLEKNLILLVSIELIILLGDHREAGWSSKTPAFRLEGPKLDHQQQSLVQL